MKKNRWVIGVICAAIAFVACGVGIFSILTQPRIIYKYEYASVSFEETLTEEEEQAIAQILEGKQRKSMITHGIPSCG